MSSKRQPLVSLVILNWDGLDDTKACLESIRKLDYPNKEVIVVDNGSVDGSKEYLRTLKDIILVDLPENTGFTGGHIAGWGVAKGEYIGLINNDLVLDKDWIAECLGTFARHKKAAVVGGKSYMWNYDNPVYDTDNDFYAYQELDPETGYTRTLMVGNEECGVDSISGAALLVKQSALKTTGYLDNDFFAYYEETDLIARLLRAGYKAYYNPLALAWHKIAASTAGGGESYFYLYMMHRNRYIFGVKNLDDTFLKIFSRNYFYEFLRAAVTWPLRPSLDKRARINAYLWNLKNRRATLDKRRQVLRLGETYVRHVGIRSQRDVTVVVPCYNYGKYVSEAIESVLVQTLLPKRIIVLNDGSTDDTEQVLKKFANNPLIEIINKENSGVIDTKNTGLGMSNTHWTIFFDADDLLPPKYIESTVDNALITRSDVVYTDMELFGAVNVVFHANPFSLGRLVRKNFIHNSALINTSMLKQVGGYKMEMKHGLEDWELYMNLAEHGAKFSYIPEPAFMYRQHDLSMSSRNTSVLKRETELYNLLLSLHPGLRKYRSRLRRWSITSIKGLVSFMIHPGLWVVLVRSLPKASLRFVETIVHELRTAKHKSPHKGSHER